MSLGQVAVDSKSNEITAIPELLANLNLVGSLVTLDAMGCQKEIAQTIVDQKAQYVLALKANQKKAFQAVAAWFEMQAFVKPWPLRPLYDSSEDNHGCLQRRRVFVSPIPTRTEVPYRMARPQKYSMPGVNSSGLCGK